MTKLKSAGKGANGNTLTVPSCLLEVAGLQPRDGADVVRQAMLAAWPITLDPIFSGLAWSLIFGIVASTAFTLLVVPVAYYALYGKK